MPKPPKQNPKPKLARYTISCGGLKRTMMLPRRWGALRVAEEAIRRESKRRKPANLARIMEINSKHASVVWVDAIYVCRKLGLWKESA